MPTNQSNQSPPVAWKPTTTSQAEVSDQKPSIDWIDSQILQLNKERTYLTKMSTFFKELINWNSVKRSLIEDLIKEQISEHLAQKSNVAVLAEDTAQQ